MTGDSIKVDLIVLAHLLGFNGLKSRSSDQRSSHIALVKNLTGAAPGAVTGARRGARPACAQNDHGDGPN